METGKTGKYFKYAIGEIVLVVIGILIALSINNWKVTQDNIKLQKIYINNIVEELSENKKGFENVLENYSNRKKKIDDFFSYLNDENVIEKELKRSLDSVDIFLGNAFFQTNVYEELKQSGHFYIFEKELREKIIAYYGQLETDKKVIDSRLEELRRWRLKWLELIDYSYYKGVKMQEIGHSKGWAQDRNSTEMMLAANFFLKRKEMILEWEENLEEILNETNELIFELEKTGY